jgi:YHS domain-containing protein
MGESVKDPVCGKEVHSDEFSAVFLGIEYGFCSVACRDRFRALPHLYAALRGQRSPRQRGLQVLRRWRLSLAAELSSGQGARVTEALETLPGIRTVCVRGNRIEIVCDLLQVAPGQIEVRLAEVGARLGAGWAERLRQGLEDCAEYGEAADRDLRPSG